ncbi:hypothetical protein QUF73_13480 [Cytobacillus sp. NJ13]|nr:hypothetical protein [Cytobacillus sp. NJ13]
MNKSQRFLLSLLAIILSFALFVIGILFAEKIPFLTVLGILGLSGVYYFVFRIVKRSSKVNTKDPNSIRKR